MAGYPPEGVVLRLGRRLLVLTVAYDHVGASLAEPLLYLLEACLFA
ncbi:unnamed protein product [Plutella xylostella]|uniref:(diamondback moth) hypothetical protein n=1 Tax=Plutella xylostella TaxID=51655 RepID=A0A8S4FWE8_PLUXY|nr:unnamed protein product [Plutella xylostella]